MKEDIYLLLEPATGRFDGPYSETTLQRWGQQTLIAYWDEQRPKHQHLLVKIIDGDLGDLSVLPPSRRMCISKQKTSHIGSAGSVQA